MIPLDSLCVIVIYSIDIAKDKYSEIGIPTFHCDFLCILNSALFIYNFAWRINDKIN